MSLINDKGSQKDVIKYGITQWSQTHRNYFKTLISPTGEILPPSSKGKSQSFENYLDGLRKFQLINEQNEFITPSRGGAVLKALFKDIKDLTPNENYKLNQLEKIYYLRLILLYDADYFLSVLYMISNHGGVIQEHLIEKFQTVYLDRLHNKISNSSDSEKLDIIDSINRVKAWRSAKRYCEDIVPPRINWLIDLEFIDTHNFIYSKKLMLNIQGQILNDFITENKSQELSITEEWLRNKFYTCSANILMREHKVTSWIELNEMTKESLVNEIFIKAYGNFSVLGLPRVSLEQSVLYFCLYSLIEKNVVVESDELTLWIGHERKIENWKLGVRHSARIYESYISVNKI